MPVSAEFRADLPSYVDFGRFLHQILAGGSFSESEAESAFELVLQGQVPDAQIAALLALIEARGATVDELAGAARVMRRHATPVPCSERGILLDTCGTGGAPKTFNISTIAALVTAAAGRGRVRVAKHGNTSRSGRGSAELLSALGVKVDAAPNVQSRCLDRVNVCFCFAQQHHPAAKHAAPVRRSLGFPTIFNLLGPLTNPAGARHQLLGVYDAAALDKVAATLLRLGSVRAMIVRGEDGLDEITTTSLTHVAEVRDGQVHRHVIDPRSLGLAESSLDSLLARDLHHAVAIARSVLSGERGPCRDIVVLNAAAALVVAGCATTIHDALSLAAGAIDNSEAARTLTKLAEESNTV